MLSAFLSDSPCRSRAWWKLQERGKEETILRLTSELLVSKMQSVAEINDQLDPLGTTSLQSRQGRTGHGRATHEAKGKLSIEAVLALSRSVA